MGCYAETTGTINIDKCDESLQVIETLRNVAEYCEPDEPVTVTDHGDWLELYIHIYETMSYGHVSLIDQTIEQLGQWVRGVARFETVCDDEPGWYYVGGTDEEVAQEHSAWVLTEIQGKLKDLVPADRAKLAALLT